MGQIGRKMLGNLSHPKHNLSTANSRGRAFKDSAGPMPNHNSSRVKAYLNNSTPSSEACWLGRREGPPGGLWIRRKGVGRTTTGT